MKPAKRLERALKSLLLAPKILLRYGTLSPTRVKFDGCDNWIHIDPQDRRAIKKFVNDPVRRRVSPPLAYWRDFLAKLVPTVAVDIGVNYGECLFGASYHTTTQVFGFEANPKLHPYLQKSRDAHPQGANITLVSGLVSSSSADSVKFYSDPSWSGTGSAVPSIHLSDNIITTEIASHTLDSKIPTEAVAGKILLFKMDIEGYESHAFGGFSKTLDAAGLAVGLIEFDTTYIRESGEDPLAYFSLLMNRFDVYRLADGQARKLLKVEEFEFLPVSRADDKRVHTDLLLITLGTPVQTWLPDNWSIVSP